MGGQWDNNQSDGSGHQWDKNTKIQKIIGTKIQKYRKSLGQEYKNTENYWDKISTGGREGCFTNKTVVVWNQTI